MVKKVVWPKSAQNQLERAYRYILEDSYQNAEKVKKEVLASTRKLANNPERFTADKYRQNNDGSFRAYELLRLGISYRITEEQIIIVRVRHTSMNPQMY